MESKLIEQIIHSLIDDSQPINTALLKTKFLASRLENEELLTWVNNELEGYQHNDNVPDYRISPAIFEGDYIKGTVLFRNQPIPTQGLDDEIRDYLHTWYFKQGISVLEDMTKRGDTYAYPFDATIVGVVGRNWQSYSPHNRFISLQSCRKKVTISGIHHILNTVRNKLLNFMLEIDKQFGNQAQIDDLKKHSKQIANIMNKTIINAGDGSIVSTGDNATINATITISKGNQEELVKYLQSIGLSKADTDELVQVIDNDNPDLANQRFGSNVNNWLGRMYTKALNGTWEIAAGATGSLLATALQNYYGWQ